MKLIPILVLSLLLQGCAFLDFFRDKQEPSIPPTQIVNIDKDVLNYCALLKEQLAIATFEDALVAYGDLATAYGTCARQQFNSVKLLKKLGNIE